MRATTPASERDRRFFGAARDDRLLVVNLGLDLRLASTAEPLLSPPLGRVWRLAWSSEHPDYGGLGVAVETSGRCASRATRPWS